MLIGGQAPKAIANVDTFDLDALRWTPRKIWLNKSYISVP